MNGLIEDFKVGLSGLLPRFAIKLPSEENSKGRRFLITTAVGLALTTGVALLSDPSFVFGQPISYAWLTFWASVAYVGFSFRWNQPIGPDQIAVLTFFGKPVDTLHSGLPFAPLGLYQIDRLDGRVIQKEFPDEPENIYHGELDNTNSLPEGKKPPIRVTFNESIDETKAMEKLKDFFTVAEIHKVNPADVEHAAHNIPDSPIKGKKEWSEYTDFDFEELESIETTDNTTVGDKKSKYGVPTIDFQPVVPSDGLSKRVTAQVVPIVRWRIKNAITFIGKMGGGEDAIKRVNDQIEDEMVTVLQRILPTISVAQAYQNMAWIHAHLHARLIRRTRDWGIDIVGANVKLIPLHHKLNKAISAATEAEFESRAEKTLIIARGEAEAEAARVLEEQTLIGRAAGQKKLAENLGVTGAEVQAAEVAREIAKGGNAVIFGGDGMAQAASVVGAMLKTKPAPNRIESKTEE
ncbi:MAG: hypothetical protein KBC62_00110 [Candidatus Pacebacteria bacterium]|nr:hypothetical protein [Candidatus Paceibacterota bacterium]MBP9842390.1 hypothetical protein [Candidatus Paceibacterota bacterium]